ncbi:spore gernimation protein GerD [Sporolactobacillus sp. THM7-4]|nr:spore gernimation protein GerD [Sporolactobacillus sp. THM7-4]
MSKEGWRVLKKGPAILIFLLLIGAAGCAPQAAQPTYQENKKMVLDMLRTDDGKRTIREMMQDKEMKNALVMDEPAVRKTIQESLTTEQGKKLWKELLEDPDFSKTLAKSMQQENEALLKKMMKDPGYQGMMMDILKAPRLQDQYLDLMKTKPFRQQLERNVQDMLESPYFKEKMIDAIGKAMKKQTENKQ